jgi:hypothetical protein
VKSGKFHGEAAKYAFAEFIDRRNLNADQPEFLKMVIDDLTERGVMDPRSLCREARCR